LKPRQLPDRGTGEPARRPVRPPLGEREGQIYVAASRLFIQKGFAGTSMSDIAEAVKITKAGLYHFVDSKEELLFTISQFGMDRLDEQVIAPAAAIADPLERLEAILKAHVQNAGRASREDGNPLTIVVDEPGGLTPEHRKVIEGRKRAYLDLLRGTLGELEVQGRLTEGVDVTAAAFAAIGAIMWIGRWWRPDGRLSLEETAEQVAAVLLNGVLRR
jgi:AcrR family transcriptional regulator